MKNEQLARRNWLEEMYDDGYFPDPVVDMVRDVLTDLCDAIEAQNPTDLAALYPLTHQATERVNALEEVFANNGSEIETAARECIGAEFFHIAESYGFADADIEALIAPRDW